MADVFFVEQLKAGHRDAFRLLVIRYQRPIFKFLSSFKLLDTTVEELAQEAFLRAYKNIGTYDEQKGASVATWLFTIAKNLASNHLAKASTRYELIEHKIDVDD